jgi:hypothetical protein
MKRLHRFGIIAAFALAVSAGAAQSATTQDVNARNKNGNNETVRVIGCLAPSSAAGGTNAATGTSGSSTSSKTSGTFMLSNAFVESTGSSSSTAAPSQSSQAASPGQSFNLVGHEKDLQKYSNARVEIRGTIEGGHNVANSGAGSTSSNTAAQVLRVNSVTRISDSCSRN